MTVDPQLPHENAHDAVDAVMRQQAAQALKAAKPAPVRRDFGPYLLMALAALCAYAWLGDPPFLRVQQAPEPTPAQREAGLRFSLYVQSQRIEHFRSTHGRLPETLAESGADLDGVEYTVLDGGHYRLAAGIEPARVVLRSSDPPDAFLGTSLSTLGFDARKQP